MFDYMSGRQYGSTPLTACRETDFNRVIEPGFDANHTELVLAELESELAPSVRHVASGQVADRTAIGKTLEFAALCAARNRRAREQMGPALRAGIASRLRSGEMSREQWNQLRVSELNNGADLDEVPEYDNALRLLADGGWFPRAPTVLNVGLVFEAAHGLHGVLRKKRWETHVTDPSTNGGFVTSDNPLVWGNLDGTIARRRSGLLSRSESLSDGGVEVTFPVSSRAALVGYSGAREARFEATDGIVAHVNARTLHFSGSLIMYGYEDFLTVQGRSVIRNGSEYFTYVADARRRGLEP